MQGRLCEQPIISKQEEIISRTRLPRHARHACSPPNHVQLACHASCLYFEAWSAAALLLEHDTLCLACEPDRTAAHLITALGGQPAGCNAWPNPVASMFTQPHMSGPLLSDLNVMLTGQPSHHLCISTGPASLENAVQHWMTTMLLKRVFRKQSRRTLLCIMLILSWSCSGRHSSAQPGASAQMPAQQSIRSADPTAQASVYPHQGSCNVQPQPRQST